MQKSDKTSFKEKKVFRGGKFLKDYPKKISYDFFSKELHHQFRIYKNNLIIRIEIMTFEQN